MVQQKEKRTPEAMLPCAIDAEEAVLGSIIIDPEAMTLVVDILRPDDFYREAHLLIYQAAITLYDRHVQADFVTISDELERKGKLDEIGGSAYLAGLIDKVPTSGNAEYYAGIIAQKAQMRRLLHASGQIAALAYEQDEQAMEKAIQILHDLQAGIHDKTITATRDMSASYMERLDRLSQHNGMLTGIPTGFKDMDRLFNGFQRSDLIILAARPAVGKSSAAMTMAKNAAAAGHGVVVFSLEMSQEQLYERLVSMEAGIDLKRLRSGWIDDEEWERVIAAMDHLNHMNIWIDDTPGITCREIESKVKRLIASGEQVDVVFVDYIQLMSGGMHDGRRQENRVQEVSQISRDLKGVARTLNIPIVALAQLSRAVESRQSKVPQLSDLRESGSLEQDADIVIFIYRDDLYNPDTERKNIADFIVAKHRNGPLGTVSLFCKKETTSFHDLEVLMPVPEEGESWEN